MKPLYKILLIFISVFAGLAAITITYKPHREHLVEVGEPRNQTGLIDLDYLQRTFHTYNDAYFDGRLNTPEIDLDETQAMATTHCSTGGVDCRLKFNPDFIKATRVANLSLLHEMCHMETWDDDQDKLILAPDDLTRHGKHWRDCMAGLDDQGAFRGILIDFYRGRGQ